MRSSFTATTGLKLSRTPSVRDQVARRWTIMMATVVGLALAGGALGLVTAPSGRGEPAAGAEPFSYFPSE
jgi:hypothetical protein